MTAVNNYQLNGKLSRISLRIRNDQKQRLEQERRARGSTLAEVLRDNLGLAFAVKEECTKVIEGEYDGNDPKNAPKLVHSLLFRVEERVLSALDSLAHSAVEPLEALQGAVGAPEEGQTISAKLTILEGEVVGLSDRCAAFIEAQSDERNNVQFIVDEFLSLLVEENRFSPEVWVGGFSEVVPRMELVGEEQMAGLESLGQENLEEWRYYESGEEEDEEEEEESTEESD